MSIAVPEPFAVSPMKREVLDLRNRFLRRALGGRRDTINEEYRCRVASAGCVQAISKEKWIRRIVSGGFNTSIIYLQSDNTRKRTSINQEQEGNNGFCQDFQFGCQGELFPSVAVRRASLGILVLVVSCYVANLVERYGRAMCLYIT